jgi:hypothetical protein
MKNLKIIPDSIPIIKETQSLDDSDDYEIQIFPGGQDKIKMARTPAVNRQSSRDLKELNKPNSEVKKNEGELQIIRPRALSKKKS